MSTEWLDVIIDGRLMQINANGDLREIGDDKPKNQIGFRVRDSVLRITTDGICAECRNKGTPEHCQRRKPHTPERLEGDKP